MTTAANPKATFHLKCSGIIDENIDPFATAIGRVDRHSSAPV
jgi:hypothetical protein